MTQTTDDAGIYRRYQPDSRKRPAVFLDRDGVIVEETGYLHKPEDVRLIDGVAQAIARLNKAGLPVIVVTNQAGVGRGYYGWGEFEAVQRCLEERLGESGAHLDAVWACGYHPEGRGALGVDHAFRKPKPGMLLDAQEKMGADLCASWLVGDKAIDVEAGLAAGLAGSILVRTGYGRAQEALVGRGPKVHVVETLAEAVDGLILARIRL